MVPAAWTLKQTRCGNSCGYSLGVCARGGLNQLPAEMIPVDAGRNGSKDSGVGTKTEFQGNKKRLPLRHEVGVML